jgi:hypothetical protein
MKSKTTNRFNYYGRWMGALAMIITLAVLSSCKDQKSSKSSFTGRPTCMKLTKAQLQDWVRDEYTKPGDPDYIQTLIFYTSDAGPGTDLQVNVRGLKTNDMEVPGSRLDLDSTNDNCTPNLPDYISIGSNSIPRSELGIFDATGKLEKNFSYLQLKPTVFTDPTTKTQYLIYDVTVVNSDGSTRPLAKGTLPCPPCPYCVPKCPVGCTPPCPEPADSTVDKTSEKL